MTAYYNENDPRAVAVLRELIKRNLIAPGIVDDRSIAEIQPADLAGFTQCHFFAGFGVWSYALRRAGWRDDRHIWTGSCPCQPFSAAGKGDGFVDPRHLWPEFYRLIRVGRPLTVIGEQVANKAGLAWLDLVSTDLEAENYTFGAADICAAGVGSPNIRQRSYWVAHNERAEGPRLGSFGGANVRVEETAGFAGGGMARGLDGRGGDARVLQRGSAPRTSRGLSDANDPRSQGFGTERGFREGGKEIEARGRSDADGMGGGPDDYRADRVARPTNGFWRDADWLFCRDGKWRPVEPGTFPLAHGAPARVGRLRGYGNALNAETATAFVEAYLEVIGG